MGQEGIWAAVGTALAAFLASLGLRSRKNGGPSKDRLYQVALCQEDRDRISRLCEQQEKTTVAVEYLAHQQREDANRMERAMEELRATLLIIARAQR